MSAPDAPFLDDFDGQPGDQYPIIWEYVRAGLPVEVIKEWGIWRQLRDSDGTIGWMNKNLLTGERHAIVTRNIRTLYEGPDLQARPVWRIEPGAIVSVTLCEAAWCRITRDGKGGYIPRNQLWVCIRPSRLPTEV